jgi:hypothetical protein
MRQDVPGDPTTILVGMIPSVGNSIESIIVLEIRDFDLPGKLMVRQANDIFGVAHGILPGQKVDRFHHLGSHSAAAQIIGCGGCVLENIMKRGNLHGLRRVAREHHPHQMKHVAVSRFVPLARMVMDRQSQRLLDSLLIFGGGFWHENDLLGSQRVGAIEKEVKAVSIDRVG